MIIDKRLGDRYPGGGRYPGGVRYPGGCQVRRGVSVSSYDYRLNKNYFFMHTVSDMNAVISCKIKEVSHFHV